MELRQCVLWRNNKWTVLLGSNSITRFSFVIIWAGFWGDRNFVGLGLLLEAFEARSLSQCIQTWWTMDIWAYRGLSGVIRGYIRLFGGIWGQVSKTLRWGLMGMETKEPIGIQLVQWTHNKEPWWCWEFPPPFPLFHRHPRTRNPIRFQLCTCWSSYCTCPSWAIG